jgi:uncharacterized membrane protein (TIGR02234 family)
VSAPADQPTRADRAPKRRLTTLVVLLVAAALALWGAGQLVWLRAAFDSPLRGRVTLTATGGQLRPELAGLALLALAGVAALLAAGRWVRRLLGLLLAAAGVWPVVRCGAWLIGGSTVSWPGAPPPTGSVPAGPMVRTPAALLGVAGGLVLLLAGLAMLVWAARLPGMGSRYAAPADARRAPDRDGELWRALDEGEDPTLTRGTPDPGPPD